MQEPTKYDSVFWIETEKIHPNPYQPRREFDDARLRALAESIRQYGVLQPLVVTRTEHTKPDGGIASEYELIAGERRLRASKLVGLTQIPAVIRGKEDGQVKLELAIIENLQREDLNSIDRAKALAQLAKEFGISHTEIGAKIGRSREYVSNSIRLLQLPDEIQQAVVGRELSEGHARALLMLSDRPEERDVLFRDIVLRKTSVRVTEQLVRRIATDKIRKHNKTQEMMELEKALTETLGTRVVIENRPNKTGRLLIEFFSPEDLTHIAEVFAAREAEKEIAATAEEETLPSEVPMEETVVVAPVEFPHTTPVEEEKEDDEIQISVGVETPLRGNTENEEDSESEVVLSEVPVIEELIIENELPSEPETSASEELKTESELPSASGGSFSGETKTDSPAGTDDSDDELYSVRNFTI